MLRGLWHLTWLEIKIFVREPLGVIGSVAVPVLIFVVLGRVTGGRARALPPDAPRFVSGDLPIFASLLIAMGAVLSLVAIVAIYREGGILRRLRATPLSPHTILTAHVVVKLLFTALTYALMIAAGRRFYRVTPGAPLVSFSIALLFSTLSILALGFLIASLVPTARFAQPVGTLINPLSDARRLRPVRAGRLAAAGPRRSGPCAAADLCRVAAEGHLARRRVAGPRGGRRDPVGDGAAVRNGVGESVSLGVVARGAPTATPPGGPDRPLTRQYAIA
jgi:ABC-2 type transport system permease protein